MVILTTEMRWRSFMTRYLPLMSVDWRPSNENGWQALLLVNMNRFKAYRAVTPDRLQKA
jgi:hypothetical protein